MKELEINSRVHDAVIHSKCASSTCLSWDVLYAFGCFLNYSPESFRRSFRRKTSRVDFSERGNKGAHDILRNTINHRSILLKQKAVNFS